MFTFLCLYSVIKPLTAVVQVASFQSLQFLSDLFQQEKHFFHIL